MFDKQMVINCEVCDARKIQEEDYAKYEKIIINTEFLLVNEQAKGVLARLPLILNAEETIELPDGQEIDLRVTNGIMRIGADSAMQEHTVLLVNGNLQILPGGEKALAACDRIHVNGEVRCPRSMEGAIGRMKVNGKICAYPDGAVLLEDCCTLDRFFPLRARQGAQYYAAQEIVVADESIDVEKLAAKGVSFVTEKLLAPESLVEALAPLFDESTKFEIVSQGYRLFYGKATLCDTLLEKYGTSLYVYGDMEIPVGSAELITRLEKLIVTGTVHLCRDDRSAFDALHAEYGKIEASRSRVIGNCVSVTVDKSLLASSPDGVTIGNAAKLRVREDVTSEEILEKLEIRNAALIQCSREQRSAIEQVSRNVAQILSGEEGEQADGEDSFLKNMADMLHAKVVNVETHLM